MNKLLVVLFSLSCFQLNAQESTLESMPISVAYWGHNFTHPGLKIGTQYSVKKWDKTKERGKKTLVKHKTSFLTPSLGFYNHRKNHTGVLLNADYGVEISRNEKKFYKAYSFGVGYARQFNAGITYVLEDDNSISEKKQASRGYIMPSLNFEFGQHFPSFSWYNKFSVGSKQNYNTGESLELFFEAGLKFYPFKKLTSNDQ